jgi:hypothetical protein
VTFRSVLVPGVLVCLTTAMTLGGCSDGGGSNRSHTTSERGTGGDPGDPGGQSGGLAVYAVDAPPRLSDLREAWVRIERLEVLGRTGVADVGSGVTFLDAASVAPITTSSGDGRPISVAMIESSRDVELLALRNGRREQLAARPVPEGTYDAVRLLLSSPRVVLTPPGGAPRLFEPQRGDLAFVTSEVVVPLSSPVRVLQGQQHALLLDFDLARSLDVLQGTVESPTRLLFSPVVRGGPLEPGAISGIVRADNRTPGVVGDDPLVEGAVVTLARSQFEVLGSTLTDATGGYSLSSVPPGQYLLMFEYPGQRTLALPIVVADASERLVFDAVLTGLVQGAVVGIQTTR